MKSVTLVAFMVMLAWHTTAQTPQHIFVFLNKKTDKTELPEEEVKKIMQGHMANINRLAKEGKLIAAGPFDGGGGIFIFKSSSVDQVRDWVSTDPGVQAKRWNVEVLPYYPRVGSVCSVNEPYQMVTYEFVRYVPNITKDNIGWQSELYRKHHDYLKQLGGHANVITESTFGDDEGGMLVVSGELSSEVIQNDPAVQQGLLVPEIQKLWIAKGAFCEK